MTEHDEPITRWGGAFGQGLSFFLSVVLVFGLTVNDLSSFEIITGALMAAWVSGYSFIKGWDARDREGAK